MSILTSHIHIWTPISKTFAGLLRRLARPSLLWRQPHMLNFGWEPTLMVIILVHNRQFYKDFQVQHVWHRLGSCWATWWLPVQSCLGRRAEPSLETNFPSFSRFCHENIVISSTMSTPQGYKLSNMVKMGTNQRQNPGVKRWQGFVDPSSS